MSQLSKYFAIIPAIFVSTYPQLGSLNVMHLGSPNSAILSAVIFNALIIVALIPLLERLLASGAEGGAQVPYTSSAQSLAADTLLSPAKLGQAVQTLELLETIVLGHHASPRRGNHYALPR